MRKKIQFPTWSRIGTSFIIGASVLLSFSTMGKQASAETVAAPKYKMRWLLAHEPVRVFERAAKHFKNEVEKASNGEIAVEVLTANEFKTKYGVAPKYMSGAVIDDVGLLKAGSIEMTQTYTTELGRLNPKMWVLDLPFLFRDHAHAKSVMDGAVGERIMAGLLESDVRGLAFTYSGGYRVISSREHAISTTDDFKKMSIRTARSPVAKAMFERLGAKTVAMNHDVGVEKVRQGSLMATETTIARLDDVQRNATPILNDTQHSLFLTSMVVNEKFYNTLPANLQTVVRTAARNAAELERKDSLDDEAALRSQFAESGMKVVRMPASEITKMKVATRPLYKQFQPMFGADLIDAIENSK